MILPAPMLLNEKRPGLAGPGLKVMLSPRRRAPEGTP